MLNLLVIEISNFDLVGGEITTLNTSELMEISSISWLNLKQRISMIFIELLF